MRIKGFFERYLFVSLILILVLSLGAGISFAYKKTKLSQAPNPEPAPTDIVITQSRIDKRLSDSNGQSRNPFVIDTGETFNIETDIKGIADPKTAAPAEVMLLIDMSESMDRPATGSGCLLWTNNNPPGQGPGNPPGRGEPITAMENDRLCYAKEAAMHLIDRAAEKEMPWKVGYQLYSAFDATSSDQYFRALKDINNENERTQLKADLIGPCPLEHCPDMEYGGWRGWDNVIEGTAMGRGFEKAARELEGNGDRNIPNYIIFLSDGRENRHPATSGCWLLWNLPGGGDRGDWPLGYPANENENPYCANSLADEIVNRLEIRHNRQEFIVTPSMLLSLDDQQVFANFCVRQSPPRAPCQTTFGEIIDRMNNYQDREHDFFRHLYDTWYKGRYANSPAEFTQRKGINVNVVGYYGDSDVTNPIYMKRIARHLHFPQDEAGGIAGYWDDQNRTSDYLRQIMHQLINEIRDQNRGAAIRIEETLPPGSDVSLANVRVERNGINLAVGKSISSDGQGRIKITVEIDPTDYSTLDEPDNQTFTLKISNISSPDPVCHDADQNYDQNGVPLYPDGQYNLWPSKVTWTFAADIGRRPIVEPMPFKRICIGTQYSGDIYGRDSIGAYAFPGIDLAASGGVNSAGGAVWNLSSYVFREGSNSSQSKFVSAMEAARQRLFKRRVITSLPIQQIISLDNESIYPDEAGRNPDGLVFYFNVGITIDTPLIIGKGNKTIIINGTLNIAASIQKNEATSGNLLFLTQNRVDIQPTAANLDAAVVVPTASINIVSSTNPIFIRGLLVAANVNLKPAAFSRRQSINYDPDLTLNPPPGLSPVDMPIFWEKAP